MSDNATLVARLNEISIKACACIPTDYYIHEKVDATFTEVAEVTAEAAARIGELEAAHENTAAAYHSALHRIDELEAKLAEQDTMIQRLGAALIRCTDDFLKLAELDRIIDENDTKIETIFAQIEARRRKGKPS